MSMLFISALMRREFGQQSDYFVHVYPSSTDPSMARICIRAGNSGRIMSGPFSFSRATCVRFAEEIEFDPKSGGNATIEADCSIEELIGVSFRQLADLSALFVIPKVRFRHAQRRRTPRFRRIWEA